MVTSLKYAISSHLSIILVEAPKTLKKFLPSWPNCDGTKYDGRRSWCPGFYLITSCCLAVFSRAISFSSSQSICNSRFKICISLLRKSQPSGFVTDLIFQRKISLQAPPKILLIKCSYFSSRKLWSVIKLTIQSRFLIG